MEVIRVHKVSKKFKVIEKEEGFWQSIKSLFKVNVRYVESLNDLSFAVPEGQIVGLVGENGAGKTTLLKILCGIIPPDTGEVTCLGYKPFSRDSSFYRQICLVSGNRFQLWWDLTPLDSFSLLSAIYEVKNYKKIVLNLAERLSVEHKLNTQLRKLSLGERMKMELIGSFIHSPKVIFLDEPTLGLDITSQAEIRKFVKEYVSKHNATAIITSHYMRDIEEICERIIFLHKGRLILDDSKEKIVNKFGKTARITYINKLNGQNQQLQVKEVELPSVIERLLLEQAQIEKIEVEDFTDVMTRLFQESRKF